MTFLTICLLAFIPRLDVASCPPDVAGFVISFVVNPVDRVLVARPPAYMGKESNETAFSSPFITHSDASPTVILRFLAPKIEAPLNNIYPALVLWCACVAVFCYCFNPKASAAFCGPTPECVGQDIGLIAAVANTMKVGGAIGPCWAACHHKSSKSFSSQINSSGTPLVCGIAPTGLCLPAPEVCIGARHHITAIAPALPSGMTTLRANPSDGCQPVKPDTRKIAGNCHLLVLLDGIIAHPSKEVLP